MPTFNRPQFVGQAVRYFLAQGYPEKELVIVDDGTDPVAELIPNDSRVRYFRREKKQALGAKRNFACEQAGGEVIVHWDDDDWSAPWRLQYQIEQLQGAQADICGLKRVFFYAPRENRAWEYVYPTGLRGWVYGASLCYTKAFWQAHRFLEIDVGEDTRFVLGNGHAKIHPLPNPRFLVALIHDQNTSPKRTADSRYRPKAISEIEALLGQDRSFYYPPEIRRLDQVVPPVQAPAKPAALVTMALGIGDILRVTPLIRVLHQMGYVVDVLVATDYPDATQLIEGAPEIRRIFQVPSARAGSGPVRTEGLADEEYDVATYTTWSVTLHERVRSKRALAFDRQPWLAEGDLACVEHMARDLGWQGELPEPFALASNRRFGLPPGTVALHPGCKYEWPWKKWHGFDELAARFPSVVIVGTDEDKCVDNTYFKRPFVWPGHAQNFVGKLSLPDTAALLRECAALIANDSGLMHLGVALGIPTFGIFGITNPKREVMRSPKMVTITKNLPCEPDCRQGVWGRRDCHRHLECLKTMTPDEVFMKVKEMLPKLDKLASSRLASPPQETEKPKETINLIYYGWVFQASGYGQAARSYLHALQRAGVNLSVVDLGGGPRAVSDPLVESLVGRKFEADFHLFHGVPPQWARHAFPLANVIAMTVWETDTMPSQWRPALNHALEVWLPCEFNTAVFNRALPRPAFKLPHPISPRTAAEFGGEILPVDLALNESDFVFYSIFEWQERKGPAETIEAFLRAFPVESNAVLVLKTNAAAGQIAAATLADARKRAHSIARVLLRCENWSVGQVTALHARGNAYISLHRGEGWNLPLFEAACLGKPIIATGFSGPLDYLDPQAHCLVRHRPAPVRQRYAYYLPSMNWAEPDVAHAVELMQQVLHGNPELAQRSAVHAERLRNQFSLEAVGAIARTRLWQLLRQNNPQKWERLHTAERSTSLKPPLPIPGDWYDEDYFEHGVKSNWTDGYTWPNFAGLFRETAEFLSTTFSESKSFLDAGCAKGFLVRALRDRGREAFGFDHSPWAIEHAEESARPFLNLAGVNDVSLDHDHDVLLSFALLESLTEAQALAFLEKIRPRIRQALVATIFTSEEQNPANCLAKDRDLSHVTVRSRAWWHGLLTRAGWRQDALHRLLERNCQRHPLPTRMAWSLFVYSPSATDRP